MRASRDVGCGAPRRRRTRDVQRQMDTEEREQRHEVSRPADAHRRRTGCVLEHQVPADDPRDQFAHRRVRVGVRAPRDRHDAGHFGIAQTSEGARKADEHHRDRHRGSRVNGGDLTGDDEDAGADDAADADGGEVDGTQRAAQGMRRRLLRVRAQRGDGFRGEESHPGISTRGGAGRQSRDERDSLGDERDYVVSVTPRRLPR